MKNITVRLNVITSDNVIVWHPVLVGVTSIGLPGPKGDKGDPGPPGGRLLTSTSVAVSSYTFALTDVQAVVEGNFATAQTFTIPTNANAAFPIGTIIEVFQFGAGQITIAADGGVTIRSDGNKVRVAGQYGIIRLRKRASDEWILSGDLA